MDAKRGRDLGGYKDLGTGTTGYTGPGTVRNERGKGRDEVGERKDMEVWKRVRLGPYEKETT